MNNVAITGIGLEIPGIDGGRSILDALQERLIPSPFCPVDKIGSKGLRYKDRATQLGLCAARAALLDARLAIAAKEQASPDTFGVIVSSNLGNIDTVCRVVETLRRAHIKETSALDLPNASSNVVASTIAIWFGCRAINLTLCSGSTSGTDALYVAATAIRSGRADRMLVVGVEPSNPWVAKLMEESLPEGRDKPVLQCHDVSGAVVLESATTARNRGVDPYGYVGRYSYDSADEKNAWRRFADGGFTVSLWLIPGGLDSGDTTGFVRGALSEIGGSLPTCLDIGFALGETYGAMGVLQAVVACQWLKKRGGIAVATSGGSWGDNIASISIHGSKVDGPT